MEQWLVMIAVGLVFAGFIYLFEETPFGEWFDGKFPRPYDYDD